jgi:hypothetical protein
MAVVLNAIKPLWVLYNGALNRRPITTKSITSGVMYGLGDIFAQMGESYKNDTPLVLNWKRIGVMTFFGTFISGPMYHYWFAYLDILPLRMLQMRKVRQKWEILRAYKVLKDNNIPVGELVLPEAKPFHKYWVKAAKIMADQVVFSSIYTAVFFMGIGTMNGIVGVKKGEPHHEVVEGEHTDKEVVVKQGKAEVEEVIRNLRAIKTEHNATALEELIQKLETSEGPDLAKIIKEAWQHTKNVYLLTYAIDWCAWPFLQLINFSLVPLKYQVLYVNVCNLFWNTFLSFMANAH